MDLIEDPLLAERILIVCNLRYVSKNSLLEKENFIESWKNFIIPKLKQFSKDCDVQNLSWTDKALELKRYIKEAFYEKEYPIWKCTLDDHYFNNNFNNGWRDVGDFERKIKELEEKIIQDQSAIPNYKDFSGIMASTCAGEARNHTIAVYGTNILSAWGKEEYSIQTGSSMAAPIATGILSLLHEYYNQYLKKPTTWVDILNIVKQSVRPIGDPSVFGLGALDVNSLFPEIFISPAIPTII